MTWRSYRTVALLALASFAALYSRGSGPAQSRADQAVRMIGVEDAATRYWPRWRGPSGQGLAVDSGYPDTWSDTQNVLWRTPVPGRGHSSPIVWADRIFLTTAYDDGRVSVLAFRRSDGQQLWEAFGPDRTPESLHPKNSHASATATTDGTAVFASFGNKGLVAVDFEGKVLWHRSLGRFDNYHGTAGSPLLYKDKLILFQDHAGGGFVTALSTKDGRPLWRTDATGHGRLEHADRDPRLRSRRDHRQQPEPRARLRSRERQGALELPRQSVRGDPDAGRRPRPGVLLVGPRRSDARDQTGRQGRRHHTHVAWQSPRGSPFVPSPLLYGDYLYIVNDMASIATSFEATTGKLMWQGRLGVATREGFSASPVGVDGKVFFTNDEGETFVLKAGPTFELLHVNKLNAQVLASPALVDRKWYFRTDRELLAIGR